MDEHLFCGHDPITANNEHYKCGCYLNSYMDADGTFHYVCPIHGEKEVTVVCIWSRDADIHT